MLVRLALAIEEKSLRQNLKRYLEKEDVLLECFEPKEGPWQRLVRSGADILIVSQSLMPRPVENSIAMLNELPEDPITVVLSGERSSDEQTGLVAAGADQVLFGGTAPKSLAEAILAVVESRHQYLDRTSLVQPGHPVPSLADFASRNESMYVFMKEVSHIARSTAPLLLLGETGVGKEHLARAIHADSPRARGPFVTVNMPAIPESLLESELFGHVQGAYTGANRSHRGAFEQAHHGTIFLDEIGEMPLHLQTRLLRTLQEYEVKPLGSETSVWVDVRVVAATNRDLQEEVRQGNFRKDLYYRLSVVPLTIPPLRDRREDIPFIVDRFRELRRLRDGTRIEISEEAMEALHRYDWPGNIRELFNVLERAVILSGDREEVALTDLPEVFSRKKAVVPGAVNGRSWSADWTERPLGDVLREVTGSVERYYIEAVLEKTNGRVGEAALMAGITVRSLYSKMKCYGIAKEDFRRKRSG